MLASTRSLGSAGRVVLGYRVIRLRLASILLTVTAIAVACGSAPTPPPPTVAPTPTATPDPHLAEPASVDRVYQELRKAGLSMAANTAESGTDPVKRLSLTYDSWPLILEEYTSTAALQSKSGFDPKHLPGFGDPAFTFAGMNILVKYGPQVQNGAPVLPEARFMSAADKLVAALYPLIGPLQQSAVAPVDLPGPTATPSPSPTPTPKATPKPKPTKKPTKKPKPTKRP